MYYNPALISQLRARPVGPGQPGIPLMGSAPGGVGGVPNAPGKDFAGLGAGLQQKQAQGNVQLPYFQEDRTRLGGMLAGQNPFAGQEWGSLISTLQDRAAGRGPSIAGDAYTQAQQNTVAAIGSQARGSGSAAAARQGLIQQGRVGQGLAQGYASARNQEMLGAQSALAGALSQRDQLNQNAYLDILAKQLGLSKDQLLALQGNQQYALGKQQSADAKSAAKWNAVGGALGGLGGLF